MRLISYFLLTAALSFAQQRTVIVISLDGFPAFAMNDPKTPVPNLRKLAADGATARHMTTVNPTVTWPNHTAIVTGVDASRHGLLVNGSIVRSESGPAVKVDPWIPKEKMVHATTVYDVAYKAGLTTAQVDWVAIQSAPTITWQFPEVPSVDGPIEREMMAKHLVETGEVQQFTKNNIFRRDEIWTDAAIDILREHKPNLLLFHLLSLDSTHHTYGPGSLAGMGAMAFLDSCVGRLVNAVQAAGMADRTTFIIVSDHGFKQVHNQVNLAAAVGDEAYVLPEGGFALVYAKSKESLPALRSKLAAVEGVADVVGADRFAEFGLPDPARDPQMADLFIVPKNGYAFGGRTGGPVSTPLPSTTGAHGYPNRDPELDAIFIASGTGIERGKVLERIRNMDVAPTVAALLGIHMPADIQGHAIEEILKK